MDYRKIDEIKKNKNYLFFDELNEYRDSQSKSVIIHDPKKILDSNESRLLGLTIATDEFNFIVLKDIVDYDNPEKRPKPIIENNMIKFPKDNYDIEKSSSIFKQKNVNLILDIDNVYYINLKPTNEIAEGTMPFELKPLEKEDIKIKYTQIIFSSTPQKEDENNLLTICYELEGNLDDFLFTGNYFSGTPLVFILKEPKFFDTTIPVTACNYIIEDYDLKEESMEGGK